MNAFILNFYSANRSYIADRMKKRVSHESLQYLSFVTHRFHLHLQLMPGHLFY